MEETREDRYPLVFRFGTVEEELTSLRIAEAVLFAVNYEKGNPQLSCMVETERCSFHIFGVETGCNRGMNEGVFCETGDGNLIMG